MRLWICGLLLALMLVTAGCSDKDQGLPGGLQAVFTKNGLAVTADKTVAAADIQLSINGDVQPDKGKVLGERTVLFGGNWRTGARYEVKMAGKSWSDAAPARPGILVGGVARLDEFEEFPTINESGSTVFDDAAVAPDGKYIALASYDNRVYVYNRTGKKLWDYGVPNGTPISAVFADDGKTLFIGEASADANLYAFETLSGNLLWKYSFSPIIGQGTNRNPSNRPKVRNLAVSGNMIVAGSEYVQRVVEKAGEKVVVTNPTQSIMMAFDTSTGNTLWRYPAAGVMDTTISRISVSADGQKVLFANYIHANPGSIDTQQYPDGVIRLINGKTGELAAAYTLRPARPTFKWVGINEGINMSPNGKYAAVFIGDNRGMLFDLSEVDLNKKNGNIKPVWLYQVSKIIQVSGVPVYASGNVARVRDDGTVYFMTTATYMADKSFALAPSFTHPDATTLFAYDRSGNILWKWQTEGGLGKARFSADSRYMVAGIYHNYVARKKERSGLYCLDLQAAGPDKLVWFYPTGGVAICGNIAADGTTIAGSESPLRREDGTLTGEHRLHILQ
ncbi:WD40 repeat domain-containing protein [Methylomusa anaerophila]|uniref:Outer membrane protein assembly factor BamB n=1 Tax=Methylomusa anaerophila TaxID=1930071 RepID=A0A348AEB4_9FIRM|nr:PQQ-binding-like beta-propeller repeat protein [Methylomusa anaerophila]BBB89412.1 outer membrane protein assembly factor BamB [Methylomusa anaerophila]